MSFLFHLFFVVTVAVFSRQQTQKSFFLLGLFIAFFCNAHEIRNKHKHSMAFIIMCFSFFSYVRAYSRNLRQHSILARKGIFLWKKSTFFEKKKRPQKFSHPYSIQSLFDSRLQYRPSICPVCSIFKNKKNKKSVTT